MNKRGRPKQENARTHGYRIRLNDEEQNLLDELQQCCNLPKSQIIRLAIFDYHKKIMKQYRKDKL